MSTLSKIFQRGVSRESPGNLCIVKALNLLIIFNMAKNKENQVSAFWTFSQSQRMTSYALMVFDHSYLNVNK